MLKEVNWVRISMLIAPLLLISWMTTVSAIAPASSFNSCAPTFTLGGSGRYYYAVSMSAVGHFSPDCIDICTSLDPRSTVAIVNNPVDLSWAANFLTSRNIASDKKVYIGLQQLNENFEPDYNWTWLNGDIFHSTPFDDGRLFQLGPNGTFMDFVAGDPADLTNPSCGYIKSDGNIYEQTNCGGANGCLCSIAGN
jgi:hypothetical protein